MAESIVEPQQEYAWHYAGLVPTAEAEALFDDPYGKEGFKELSQGHEEVSAGDWLVSSRFAQCSARILINQIDGSVLMKHVGPKSHEAVFGGDSGLTPQDEYVDFFEHARQTGATILACNVAGGRSSHKLTEDHGSRFEDIAVVELPEIRVESGREHTWSIAFNPTSSEAIVKLRDQQGEVQYEKYQLPKAGSEENADSRERLVQRVERRRVLNRCLEHLGSIPLSSMDFQNIDETREGIMASGDMLLELEDVQLRRVEYKWTRSFVKRAEIAKDVEQLAPAMQALEIFMDASQAARKEGLSRYHRVHQLSHLVLAAVTQLETVGPRATAMGKPVLLNYLDSEIKSLPRRLKDADAQQLITSIKQLRSMCDTVTGSPDVAQKRSKLPAMLGRIKRSR